MNALLELEAMQPIDSKILAAKSLLREARDNVGKDNPRKHALLEIAITRLEKSLEV